MPTNNAVRNSPDYIVGIGASAGGLAALERFFAQLPPNSGLAFVVIQHLSPKFESKMDELLARHTQVTIQHAENEMPVEANTVYLNIPGKNMTLSQGKLMLFETDPSEVLNLPIDIFFRSLATEAAERAIGVILSGTGSDGSRGLVDLHQAGGLILVQEEESAGFNGMPRNAIKTGLVDAVLPPEDMPEKILTYVENGGFFPLDANVSGRPILEQSDLADIFDLLHRQFEIDFAQYKPNTILRRLERRMTLTQCSNLRDYYALLHNNKSELSTLFRDLLIDVSKFFRDSEAFEFIQQTIIPELVENAADEIRVWVPGCATGEEAYSLAILFAEYLEPNRSTIQVRIFATDAHQQSIKFASTGFYSKESTAALSPAHLERYFLPKKNGYLIGKKLRKMVTFAPQNLLQDPPFTNLDLISCRNVLIYFQTTAQQRVLSNFHFGLKPKGYLFLGPSEHIGRLGHEFEMVNRAWRIFRKRRDVRLPAINLTPPLPPKPLPPTVMGNLPPQLSDDWVSNLVAEFVPSGFLLNENFDILYIFGNANRYLRPHSGQATLNALKMLEGDLKLAVRTALYQAIKKEDSVAYTNIQTTINKETALTKITVKPIAGHSQMTYFFVGLEVLAEAEITKPAEELLDTHQASETHILNLERELVYTKQHLETTVEELETSNEEIQSTNQELISTNEELQSTNEELQSVNEELYTVNAEHQRKIEELVQLTNDLKNLQNSTQIGVIFLDTDLYIREFTPAIAGAFNLLEQDIGRPLEHVAYNIDLDFAQLRQAAVKILAGHKTQEFETKTRDGVTYLLRLLPYQTDDNVIAGVVLTFVDITARVQADQQLAESRARLTRLFDEAPALIIMFEGPDHTVSFTNQAFNQLINRQELIGKPLHEALPELKRWHIADMLDTVYQTGRPIEVTEHAISRERELNLTTETIYLNIVCQPTLTSAGAVEGVMFFGFEVTEMVQGRRSVEQNEAKFRVLFESAPTGILAVNSRGQILLANPAIETIFGYSPQELIDQNFDRLIPDRVRDVHHQHFADYFAAPTSRPMSQGAELVAKHKAGHEFPVEIGLNFTYVDDELWALSFITDITIRKELESLIEENLQEKTAQLEAIIKAMPDALLFADPQRRIVMINPALTKIFGYTFDELAGRHTEVIYSSPEAYEEQGRIRFNLSAEEKLKPYEIEYRRKDGVTFPSETVGTQVRAEDGSVMGFIGLMRDITDRKQAEKALAATTRQLQLITNNVPARISYVDREQRIQFANRQYENLIDLPRQHMIGRPVAEIIGPERYKQAKPYIEKVLSGQSVSYEGVAPPVKGGGFQHELLTFIPDIIEGEVQGFFALVVDITNQKQAEAKIKSLNRELRQANALLEERVQARTRSLEEANRDLARSNAELEQFAYAASHDLQEPLNTIGNYVGLLQERYADQLEQPGTLFLTYALEAAARLKTLVTALLDYSRLRQVELTYKIVDCNQLLESISVDLHDALERSGGALDYEVCPTVVGNEALLRQLLQNLISNGLKFHRPDTPPEILITAEEEPDRWLFRVQDNGIGIEEKYFEQIFGIFRRLHIRSEFEGTGLGLALCKKIVELHQGEIWLTSQPGAGTTFYFTIGKTPDTEKPDWA